MIRLAQQMAFLGYYGDPRTFESVGYVPFSKRERYGEAMAQVAKDRPKVTAQTPGDVDGELEADAVVIGSGAAGALLAYRLAEAGRHVLVLERGQHVDPEDFNEDEVEMISRLYSDGALQLSRDFRFQVLQGMCVGGSTVINNAVCFEIPDAALKRWNDVGGLDAGLDEDRLRGSFKSVTELLRITEQPDSYLNPGARKFAAGIEKLGLNENGGFGVVRANIADCFGCGYCNIGCAYGKKLSVLDTLLPEGQQKFGERLRILAECRAEEIETSNGRATAVRCRLSDGRKLRVRGETIVVSAGAINSSWLLMQSGIAKDKAGRKLGFNMASPMTADFDEELHSYDGLQISHFLEPPAERGFVFETWFNPVVSQALNMPGWFNDHYRNMRRYAHMTAAGVLVGTEGNARVRRAWSGGPDIQYQPSKGDLDRLIEGLKLLGKVYLSAGARRVLPNLFTFREFTTEAELDRLGDYVQDASDLSLGTGHPQGGNPVSRDPGKGVVDPQFRVHGMENLYVCDASAFPASITVNPQMTVMALAEYAAPAIAGS
jgi:choline dehydrogenase-like flavoprotein